MSNLAYIKRVRNEIRERIWSLLVEKGEALPPYPVRGRIPNFKCARRAAEKLVSTEEWRGARVVKINPDSPQRPLRKYALYEGKLLIMPTPRLRRGFILLDPALIPRRMYARASTIRGAFEYGRILSSLDEIKHGMPRIDLIVEGSVAVDRQCNRLGKGEGYGDIEYAILAELGKVNEYTPAATTISELQLVDKIPRLPNDLPLDLVATPKRILRCESRSERPKGLLPEYLEEKKVGEIPLLKELLMKLGGD